MSKEHPPTLLKLLAPEAAVAVLASGRLRWSSPDLFSDPFELRSDSPLSFDRAGLQEAVTRATVSAVLARQPYAGLPDHPMTNVVRRWRAQGRFTRAEEVEQALAQALPTMVDRRFDAIEALRKEWAAFVQCCRVLCLFERHTEPSLWRNFAADHAGIALRLRCEDGGSFEHPLPVTYQQRRPQITTLGDEVEMLTGQSRGTNQESRVDRLLAKSRSDADEHEWRCVRQLSAEAAAAAQPAWQDNSFQPDELVGVYLGCRIAPDLRERVLALVQGNYPRTRVLQASVNTREFALDFMPLLGSTDEESSAEAPVAVS